MRQVSAGAASHLESASKSSACDRAECISVANSEPSGRASSRDCVCRLTLNASGSLCAMMRGRGNAKSERFDRHCIFQLPALEVRSVPSYFQRTCAKVEVRLLALFLTREGQTDSMEHRGDTSDGWKASSDMPLIGWECEGLGALWRLAATRTEALLPEFRPDKPVTCPLHLSSSFASAKAPARSLYDDNRAEYNGIRSTFPIGHTLGHAPTGTARLPCLFIASHLRPSSSLYLQGLAPPLTSCRAPDFVKV